MAMFYQITVWPRVRISVSSRISVKILWAVIISANQPTPAISKVTSHRLKNVTWCMDTSHFLYLGGLLGMRREAGGWQTCHSHVHIHHKFLFRTSNEVRNSLHRCSLRYLTAANQWQLHKVVWYEKVTVRECIQKFPDWVDNEIKTNTRWEATQRVIAAKITRLTHRIVIQLHLVAESCTICSYRSRRPVRKLLDTPLYRTSWLVSYFQVLRCHLECMKIPIENVHRDNW
jgi:hypothetical protein